MCGMYSGEFLNVRECVLFISLAFDPILSASLRSGKSLSKQTISVIKGAIRNILKVGPGESVL